MAITTKRTTQTRKQTRNGVETITETTTVQEIDVPDLAPVAGKAGPKPLPVWKYLAFAIVGIILAPVIGSIFHPKLPTLPPYVAHTK